MGPIHSDSHLSWHLPEAEGGLSPLDRGDGSGRVSAKNVYNALAALSWNSSIPTWRQRLWKATCPLKYKLHTWLMLEQKLLFWDQLQRRGWEGPSRCALCAQDADSSLHVLVNCPFTKNLWTSTSAALKIQNHWTGTSIISCFKNWIHNSTLTICCHYTYVGMSGFPEMPPSSLISHPLLNSLLPSSFLKSLFLLKLLSLNLLGSHNTLLLTERWPGLMGPPNREASYAVQGEN
jgi:hypothetical protein